MKLMVKALVKLALVAVVLKWLKPRWKSLGVLLGVFIVTSTAHSEYVEYVEISKISDFLFLSYILKWAIFVFSLGLYIFFRELKVAKREESRTSNSSNGHYSGADDGFDSIRSKAVLRPRGKQILGED